MAHVVTLGEAMLRLAPPGFQRLEQADGFRVTVGGSELSVAAGLSRLGVRCAWVSRLPASPLGRMIAGKAREQGVSTDHVLWVPGGRAGLYFVECGSTPRATEVIYDRKGSAASLLRPGEVPWPDVLRDARLFHTSGITPALSAGCGQVTREALRAARDAGCLVSFDLNYRSKLWTPEEARACFEEILPGVDILLGGLHDARDVLGFTGTPDQVVRDVSEAYRIPTVALMAGEAKSVRSGTLTSLLLSNGTLHREAPWEVEVVDRFGVGDAFAAGLLYGLLHDGPEQGLQMGSAMAALKMSVPGDIPWVTPEEVRALVRKRGDHGVKR